MSAIEYISLGISSIESIKINGKIYVNKDFVATDEVISLKPEDFLQVCAIQQ